MLSSFASSTGTGKNANQPKISQDPRLRESIGHHGMSGVRQSSNTTSNLEPKIMMASRTRSPEFCISTATRCGRIARPTRLIERTRPSLASPSDQKIVVPITRLEALAWRMQVRAQVRPRPRVSIQSPKDSNITLARLEALAWGI